MNIIRYGKLEVEKVRVFSFFSTQNRGFVFEKIYKMNFVWVKIKQKPVFKKPVIAHTESYQTK